MVHEPGLIFQQLAAAELLLITAENNRLCF